jgi:D-3-phosphoglycerate dehydrogenase
MTRMRVLVTCPQLQGAFDAYRSRFDELDIDVELPEVLQQLSEEEMAAIIDRFDGAIVGDDVLSSAVLHRASRLRVVAKWGIGVDNIDLRTASQLGIRVTNTPGVFGDEVADVVIGYLVLLARGLHTIDRRVRAGEWTKVEGVSLARRRLGVIGFGSIGQAVARRGQAMAMTVVAHDVAPAQAEVADAIGIQLLPLEELIAASDIVSLNCPLTDENQHMMDERRLSLLPRGAWVINTARGPLIDEKALVAALRSGQVGAAALDVFESEPLPAESELRQLDSVILGSHNASNTAEGVRRVSDLAVANLLAGLAEVRR